MSPDSWDALFNFLSGHQLPNWALIIGWVVPAYFAIRTLVSLNEQVKATNDSATAAKQANEFARSTLEMTRRARVSIQNVTIEAHSWESEPTLSCTVMNTGEMPATGVVRYLQRSQVPPAVITHIEPPRPKGTGEIIDPRSEVPYSIGLTIPTVSNAALITPTEWQQIIDGTFEPPLQIGICVSYWDGFDSERLTESWYKYNLLKKDWERTYIHQS